MSMYRVIWDIPGENTRIWCTTAQAGLPNHTESSIQSGKDSRTASGVLFGTDRFDCH